MTLAGFLKALVSLSVVGGVGCVVLLVLLLCSSPASSSLGRRRDPCYMSCLPVLMSLVFVALVDVVLHALVAMLSMCLFALLFLLSLKCCSAVQR